MDIRLGRRSVLSCQETEYHQLMIHALQASGSSGTETRLGAQPLKIGKNLQPIASAMHPTMAVPRGLH